MAVSATPVLPKKRNPEVLQLVERTLHPAPATVEDVGIDHRRAHVGMAEQFLNRADVVARLQQVRCERMPPIYPAT